MKARTLWITCGAACALTLAGAGARDAHAQLLILEDPLTGSTLGTQNGGSLEADGWHVTATDNSIYWHIPTLRHGAVEFSVRGLRPEEARPGNEDKGELFHMYDYTFDDADTNYGGYRNNPFKHFIRKTGVLDDRPGRTDSLELLWVIAPNVVEPDSPVLSWDPSVTYRFREEWGPDGAGNSVINTYRDGVHLMTMSQPGEWAPAGHSVRIGVARLTPESGAPLDAVFSGLQVWDLSQTGMNPGPEPAPPDALPSGRVRVVGSSLVDDNGAFLGLGATYMTALWQVKNSRAQLESDLALFRAHGFNYVRVLGQVGGMYWSGLDIAPVDQRNEDGTIVPAWPDYEQQLRDLLDVVWAHGMRTELTIFGSASNVEGGPVGRQAVVDMVLSAIAGREDEVILLEVANEGWQTGFPGPEGLAEMRSFANYLAGATQVPVAITSNHGENTIQETYAGADADIATWHVSRDLSVDEGWGPVWDPWALSGLPGVPPVSSNEPIGPGSSVASEDTPIRLVMAAAFAYVAKLPMYVFHSRAGVRHQERFEDMAGLRDFRNLRTLLPGDVASWARNDGKEASAPFTSFAGGQPDRYWPEVGSDDGCVRNTGARKGDRFVTIPIGIHPGGLTLEARQPIAFQVYDPITAELAGDHDLGAGERVTLPQGPGAWVITNVELGPSENGLAAEYFDDAELGGPPVIARRDRRIDFDWGEGSPAGAIGADTFSVRWRGFVVPRYSETYTFSTATDDGSRVWIDGRLVIDDWTTHGADAIKTGTADLVADRRHSIVVEYFENTGFASARLSWASARQAAEVVPADRLFPPRENDAAFVLQAVPESMEAGRLYRVSVRMRNTGTATWSMGQGHRLGAQSPQGNEVFGGPAELPASEAILPGAEHTFELDVTAPAATGEYDFQRQMVKDGVEWFGDSTPRVRVRVVPAAEPGASDAGVAADASGREPPVPVADAGATAPPPGVGGEAGSGGCGCTTSVRARAPDRPDAPSGLWQGAAFAFASVLASARTRRARSGRSRGE